MRKRRPARVAFQLKEAPTRVADTVTLWGGGGEWSREMNQSPHRSDGQQGPKRC